MIRFIPLVICLTISGILLYFQFDPTQKPIGFGAISLAIVLFALIIGVVTTFVLLKNKSSDLSENGKWNRRPVKFCPACGVPMKHNTTPNNECVRCGAQFTVLWKY